MHAFNAVAALLLSGAVTSAQPLVDRQDSRFTFYPLVTPASGPCDLAEGPDGALWGQDILVDKLFRINTTTGHVDEFTIPFTTPINNVTVPGIPPEVQDRTAFSCAIRSGADGNLYAANGLRNQLVRINPSTKKIDIFEPPPANPAGNLQPFNDLYSAQDGIYSTQTTGNVFNFFSFATEQFATYTCPTPLGMPLGLLVASDKKVYIAELTGNKILIFDPSTQKIEEYAIPTPGQLPAVVRAEHDGYVYFTTFTGDGLGRINMATHAIDLFPSNQTGGLGSEETIDKSGGVWLSYFTVDALARLDTKTFNYSYVPFPQTFAAAGLNGVLGDVPPNVDVAVNYGPGNAVYFTSIINNHVGRYDLTGLY